jgi:hypothetical protein
VRDRVEVKASRRLAARASEREKEAARAWAGPRERRGAGARSAGGTRGRPGWLRPLGQKWGGGPVKLRTPFFYK